MKASKFSRRLFRHGLLGAVILVCIAATSWADGGLLEHGDFESDEPGASPENWRFPSPHSKTAARVVEPGARGSSRCLRIEGRAGRRLTVLETRLAAPADRLLLDFCFAFSEVPGEAFVLQSEARGGSRPTQLRIAIQDGRLVHFDGEAGAWKLVTDRIEPTLDPAKPRWHRVEVLAHRALQDVTFWVSPPGSTTLPEAPTATLVAHRIGSPFHSLKLTCGEQSPEAFVLVDQIRAEDASDIPPPWMRRLLEIGRVSLEYYDPATGRRGLGGLTKFHLKASYKFGYRYRWAQADDQMVMSLKPTLRRLSLTVSHRIYVPNTYDRPGRWERRLMRHEFEHVAISTDPRVRMLLDHLCRNIGWVERTYDAGQRGSRRLYDKVSLEEMNKRRHAVDRLIQENYNYFDSVCSHGRKPIEDRRAFFAGLYTRENLEAMEFPYLENVLNLLETDEYRAAQPCCGD